MNVLITNVGRRGYLVDFLKASKDFCGKIYVSDCSKSASGLYGNNDGSFILPKPIVDEKKYIEKLTELCKKLDISIVFPVIDPEIDILSKYVEQLASKNIHIVVSSRDVLDVCWSKLKMNDFLKCHGFAVPQTYTNLETFKNDLNNNLISFPVILKPVFGSGSEETYKIKSLKQLEGLFHDGLMIQALINGNEYGCDTLNNLQKTPVRCVIKRKLSMRSGETDKAITVNNLRIQNAVLKLAKDLGHIGNLDCDLIDDGKELYFIDLNPRFGGGYPMSHAAGVNYLDLILKMYEGIEITPEFNNYEINLMVMKTVSLCTKKIDNEADYE